MKKLLPFILFLSPSSAFAEITAKYVTSAQISIDSPYVITNAAPSSYSISGNNVTTSTGTGDSIVTNAIGGLNLGSLTNGVPAAVNTNKTVTTAGSAFSFSESFTAGDNVNAIGSGVDVASGVVADMPAFGETTTQSGGVAGTLAGTILSSGVMTIVAGGAGTTATGQFVSTISVD